MNAPPIRQDAPDHRGNTGITARPPRVLVNGHPTDPAVVVYRVEIGRHRQTGVVVEVSINDYRTGRIRRHEDTQPARVRQIDELTEATGVEQMPVMLVHRGHLHARLGEITAARPEVHVTSKGVAHSVWIRREADLMHALNEEISRISTLYIADGHHRMLAAERYAARRRHLGDDHPSAFTLAALFPSDEMRILGYHRCFALSKGSSAQDVLDRLAAQSVTARIEESAAPETERGVVAVGLGGRWYRLSLRSRPGPDAFAIDEELLPKLHDLTDHQVPTAPNRHHAMETCWCETENAIRLIPHPPTIEDVLATSDAGLLMPPKSTWFDPKPNPDLFRRSLTGS
ncbi:DUF1015 family protein [Saccharopolyspora sp. K220]|uniref:DUF1015 family protein n=1 Tax=Saccharopolyspora soli TaxID=2926618 RepID=UPI001F5901BE|nr:DUF1015 family protein [Saccharopolyspora soli]MCI2421772.1 DUF1015 family protein [Saccharopolyspora soli]